MGSWVLRQPLGGPRMSGFVCCLEPGTEYLGVDEMKFRIPKSGIEFKTLGPDQVTRHGASQREKRRKPETAVLGGILTVQEKSRDENDRPKEEEKAKRVIISDLKQGVEVVGCLRGSVGHDRHGVARGRSRPLDCLHDGRELCLAGMEDLVSDGDPVPSMIAGGHPSPMLIALAEVFAEEQRPLGTILDLDQNVDFGICEQVLQPDTPDVSRGRVEFEDEFMPGVEWNQRGIAILAQLIIERRRRALPLGEGHQSKEHERKENQCEAAAHCWKSGRYVGDSRDESGSSMRWGDFLARALAPEKADTDRGGQRKLVPGGTQEACLRTDCESDDVICLLVSGEQESTRRIDPEVPGNFASGRFAFQETQPARL